MTHSARAFAILAALACCWSSNAQPAVPADYPAVPIGVARIDITPDFPVRLAGYAGRKTESEGVIQRLWAKALAIGSDEAGPAVLVTVDSIGVSASMVEPIALRLQEKAHIPRERFVVCSTHTHTGPCLKWMLPTMFGQPYPPDHQAHIDRYAKQLTEKIEQVALAALADRRLSRLAWTQGRAGFATNRRAVKDNRYAGFGANRSGSVDQALPMLCASEPDGRLRAVLVGYACHNTTLGSDTNRICGDWAGYAQEEFERDHPGAILLVSLGCGADADPQPRTGLDFAKRHGREVADEVNRLLQGELKPLSGPPACRFERINLPFDRIPTREEWQARAQSQPARGAVAYHASVQLAKLDRGETLPTTLPYSVQTWAFGRDLAMVFLAGEVVVDYSLALKKEFDPARLWVAAYANDVPCYIPSKRILAEGGYEADESMIYFDRPARFAPQVEDLLLAAVRRTLPRGYAAPAASRLAP